MPPPLPQSLEEAQQYLSTFSDPVERRIAEEAIFNASFGANDEQKHILVLLHGMNTYAEWQEILAEPLRNQTNLEPLIVGYGNFHPLKFFLPALFRKGRIQVVLNDLRGIRQRHPEARISIVAHSFGTYIISKILLAAPELRFHRLVLCGAIIPNDYNWAAVTDRLSWPVVNDIGRRDIWPSLARSWSWGYGDSGAVGFKNSAVRDRYFPIGHSDFLNIKHMKKYWLPYLIDGQIVQTKLTIARERMGFLERAARGFGWGKLILTGLALTCGIHFAPSYDKITTFIRKHLIFNGR